MPLKPPAEGLTHLIQDGEWAGSIAIRYGFADWEKDVWQHAKNAQLREKRKDPHVLAKGDQLFIPPWEEKEETGATEQCHKFKLKTPSELFRLRILDTEGEPVKNSEYTLKLEYGPGGGTFKQKKTRTDDQGVVEETIPSTAISGILLVPDAGIELHLDFGHLDPMDPADEVLMIKGAQQRLNGLGYYAGPIDGKKSAALESAVIAFQKFCQQNKDAGDPSIIDPGEIDGTLNDKTRHALQKFYGC